MPQTLIEKIAQKYSPEIASEVHSGDYISISPAYVLTHDNTGAVMQKFNALGASRAAKPGQIVIALDHNIQDKSEKNIDKYKRIEAFAQSLGAHFFPAGRGIGHQIMLEEGFALPYTMAVASDSHANMYGGLGCLGTPIVRTDAAGIWATGKTWWQIPPVAKVMLTGSLQQGVCGKDVILTLCNRFSKDEVLNHALEFSGDGCHELSIEDRLTIANMSTEWGALAAVFPVDEKTIEWLRKQSSRNGSTTERKNRISDTVIEGIKDTPVRPDENAQYSKTIYLNLHTVEPFVAGPSNVKTAHPASYFNSNKQVINKAYLLSCVNGRVDDFRQASEVAKNKTFSQSVTFYMSAASSEIQAACEEHGYWQTLLAAGAVPLPPGCGTCIGLGTGLLEAGEVGISATNRNFKGRMGHPDAQAYLASPAIVTASAIAGYIDYPAKVGHPVLDADIKSTGIRISGSQRTETIDSFPPYLSGDIICCLKDNINTDGIYPGKYTYVDDFTPEQQATVVMENYDTEFTTLVERNDILVAGFNFGTGSSREQAATALKYRGIQLVIAGSFNETYKRNALNNGFLVVDSPDFVTWLKDKFSGAALTIRPQIHVELDFHESMIWAEGSEFTFGSIGPAAQDLIVTGGLENWIKQRIGQEKQL